MRCRDGWLRTGDLAKYDNDGDYLYCWKEKRYYYYGGENVYPQEIEQCLILFQGINEAAVVGIKDDKWGEAIIAFITVADGYAFNHDKVIDHCKKFLGV